MLVIKDDSEVKSLFVTDETISRINEHNLSHLNFLSPLMQTSDQDSCDYEAQGVR